MSRIRYNPKSSRGVVERMVQGTKSSPWMSTGTPTTASGTSTTGSSTRMASGMLTTRFSAQATRKVSLAFRVRVLFPSLFSSHRASVRFHQARWKGLSIFCYQSACFPSRFEERIWEGRFCHCQQRDIVIFALVWHIAPGKEFLAHQEKAYLSSLQMCNDEVLEYVQPCCATIDKRPWAFATRGELRGGGLLKEGIRKK